DGFGPLGVPVQALSHIPDTAFILQVEGGDALAVLVAQAGGLQAVGHKAVAAGVEGDDFGNGEGTLDHGLQLVTHLDVLEIAGIRALRLFLGVDGVDLLVVFVSVGGGLEGRVLALAAGFAALGEHLDDTVDTDNFTALVDAHIAVGLDHRAVGKLGFLLFEGLQAAKAVDAVAGIEGAVPVPLAAGDKDVNAAEHALGGLFDLIGDAVAEHRGLDMADLGAVADLAAPAGVGAVVFVGIQRV